MAIFEFKGGYVLVAAAVVGGVVYHGLTRREPPELVSANLQHFRRGGRLGFLSSGVREHVELFYPEYDNGMKNAYRIIYDNPLETIDKLLQAVVDREIHLVNCPCNECRRAGNSSVSSASIADSVYNWWWSGVVGEDYQKACQTVRIIATVVTIKLRHTSLLGRLGLSVPTLWPITTFTAVFYTEYCRGKPPMRLVDLVNQVSRFVDTVLCVQRRGR